MNLVQYIKSIKTFYYYNSYNFTINYNRCSFKSKYTKKKKLERELSNRIEFDKVLLDTIPNAIYYKNVDGHF